MCITTCLQKRHVAKERVSDRSVQITDAHMDESSKLPIWDYVPV